ncbi:PfkB family carbohydrate kinase [Pseudomonadota bacterium]
MTATGGEQYRPIEERPVIFGEVLFDTFPDGAAVLGGAPFNVAWHLQGFGLNPLFISRVGSDIRGEEVQSAMNDWGMDSSGLQIDPQCPTGLVQITLDEGQPDFTILPNQSYDYIDEQPLRTLTQSSSIPLLYFGTLITRGQASSRSLSVLKEKSSRQFVDINLRKACWTFETVHTALQAATWVKLNDEELIEIASHNGISTNDIYLCARELKERFEIQSLIITQGAKGAFIIHGTELTESEPEKVATLVDAVGAGDAFSSVVMLGILKSWPVDCILKRAVQFAAELCAIRGATTNDKQLYNKYIQQWGVDAG